jgi:signal transduction histidine kinase/ActR/RegA family two-component response regulator
LQQELGSGWAENVHHDDMERCLSIYESSFDAKRPFQMEYRLRRADGEYRWLLDNGIPRLGPDGVFAGYIGSCIDITDLRRAQEEDLAKQKLQTVGTLAEGIVHDFNNLLGGVLAHAELALTELAEGNSDTEEELRKIRMAAIHGSEIVRQLMIYAGQESEVLESVSISAIVEEILALLKVTVSKHVTVQSDLREDLPLVRARPSLIRQVVMNLVSNASEAIGDREGMIRVATTQVTTPAADRVGVSDVQLEVTDTGRGMTPAVQARVFDPFFTTKITGSHGHGLTVVKRIVERLHGTIRVLSEPGRGTTFQILLPGEALRIQTNSGQIANPTDERPGLSQKTALFVDDEDLLREAVSKMLRKQGLSVIEVRDGSAALRKIRARQDPIDVLILDVTLPGASSRDVYEEARRIRPALPVIFTSAKSKETAAASVGTGIERFLRKPFSFAELREMIRDILCPRERTTGVATD